MSGSKVVAFLGPSLGASEARSLGPIEVRPPAQRGDVWRAVDAGATVIALIDGLFERVPSVWHRELKDALDSGVTVLGASSMGALRAAELRTFGMVPFGTIAGWYATGECVDDADVALVHADAEHHFRPLSVPHVNVRWNVERARRAKALSAREAERVLTASAGIFYVDRLWPEVIGQASLPPSVAERFRSWLAAHEEDLKSLDARGCLQEALKRPSEASLRRTPSRVSSLVRRVRLFDSVSLWETRALSAQEVLNELAPDQQALIEAGLRRSLLAARARELGMRASPEELEQSARSWAAGIGSRSVEHALAESGLTRAELDALLEEVVLESRMMRHSTRVTTDGPSPLEAFANEARLTGAWARVVRSRRARRR